MHRSTAKHKKWLATALLVSAAMGCNTAEPPRAGALGEATGQASSALTQAVPTDADTHVRVGFRNESFGDLTPIGATSNGRVAYLVRFDTAMIAAAAGADAITSAVLQLEVAQSGVPSGQTHVFELHRLTRSWTEAGATWSCPDDTNTANSTLNCPGGTWNLASPGPNPWVAQQTGSLSVTSMTSGVVSIDVTSDVNAFVSGASANDGWILFVRNVTTTGFVLFNAKESASGGPELLITTASGGGGCGAGQHDGGGGACVPVGTCSPGFGDCNADGTCEQRLDTAARCGGCNTSCDDNNTCTTDACSAQLTCTHAPVANSTPCGAGNACAPSGTCQSGVCSGGSPVECVPRDPCHLAGTCDPSTGQCSNPQAPDGTSCDDGDGCTSPDTCQSGACTGALPLACGQAASPPGSSAPVDCPAPACRSVNVAQSPSLIMTRATHPTVLARFGFQRVLLQLIARAGVGNADPLTLFRTWWDSLNDTQSAAIPGAVHCDANGSTVNGFPIECPRAEGQLATAVDPFNDVPPGNPELFRPVAIVNRFDLAPLDGAHCGEYRIVYARQSGVTDDTRRVTIIFEGQLPNPNPQCGLEACRPVADFWASLASIGNQTALADAVESFYFDGLPGFRPIIHPQNYGMTGDGGVCGTGGGQIRTNLFLSGTPAGIRWQLREFQLDRSCTGQSFRLRVLPVSVKTNPFGGLFVANAPSPATAFRSDFLAEVAGLSASATMDIHMNTLPIYNAGQSSAIGPEKENDYVAQISANSSFLQSIGNTVVQLFGSQVLTAQNVVDRATSQSCAGCHHLSGNKNLGRGVVWPAPLPAFPGVGFLHIDEVGNLSPALTGTFLPKRAQVLSDFFACQLPAQGAGPAALAPIGATEATIGGRVTH